MNERPVIFTVTENRIYTKDGRIADSKKEYPLVFKTTFETMATITKYGNEQGYAVLFEVD